MRVLVVHSRYATGASSGENQVVADEVRLLRDRGHEVHLWSPAAGDGGGAGNAVLGARAVWSRFGVRGLEGLVRDFGPDLVHAHNLFPMLSPAVLRHGRTPVVLTLHNYRLLCLPATFMRDGRTCEDCFGRVPWRGVVHRCYRGSALGSAALAASITAHRALRTFHRPTAYLAVSEYVRQRHVEAGLDPERVWVKPNFAWPAEPRVGPGEYFLYVGRFSPEKALDRLLALWPRVPARLLVAGDGPARPALEAMAPDSVTFLGSVPHARVPELLRGARALVLPTLAYEGAPRTVVEAYAAGVPVVASRIGALPFVVDEGETGYLADLDEPAEWVAALTRMLDDDECQRLGRGALRVWEERFSPDRAIADLERVYSRAAGEPTSSISHNPPTGDLTVVGDARIPLTVDVGDMRSSDRDDREV
jgi:glycosyltransferase involved in cell wall biosynthesis